METITMAILIIVSGLGATTHTQVVGSYEQRECNTLARQHNAAVRSLPSMTVRGSHNSTNIEPVSVAYCNPIPTKQGKP